ncbi:CvpA family protein [Rhizobium redzepovicii]|uniref:CvpA family protein n=1 Tax=Rhizobium redzepovicii TaxID=2867518 RepID=A0AAW8P479_9HYPH|nr:MULTISPECIES: CvpA family protein [Rhizobium]MBB3526053.1 membrane protein required for colicin V production [Rhizobium sp. BK456]MBY4589922.1 CvpA family protein [Rhizobium redzepovicii]MBY4614254.1 CvpA family protein [Rhizobium redzepovicii]MDF0661230.1 CvpA family protein [Rhizobium sp. BC49]MDR9761883.1 CvpA family protein [Rhizobium redzepovicii]
MPITIFDGIVIGVVLFSAVLAMVRGFSREILSIASWGGSAAAAYYLYPYLLPYAKKYTDDDRIAIVGSAAVVFLIALIVISFITMKIADFIIDSRVGALDRTLGFLFGAARGVLLLVVAVAFWNWLVDADHRPAWVNEAKSKPFLDSMVVKLKSVLPEQFAQMIPASIRDKLQPPAQGGAEGTNPPTGDQAPAEDAPTAPAQQPAN